MKAKRFLAHQGLVCSYIGAYEEVVLAAEAETEIAALEKECDAARAALEQETTAHRLDCQSYRAANASLRAEGAR